MGKPVRPVLSDVGLNIQTYESKGNPKTREKVLRGKTSCKRKRQLCHNDIKQ